MQTSKERRKEDLQKVFVQQQNQSWCGLACLSSICKYYGGEITQEKLVNISGTNVGGTTLLGLYQAANSIGLVAEGLAGNIEELKKIEHPAILHFTLEDGLLHYVVYFGHDGVAHKIIDPAKGYTLLSDEELTALWKTKTLLLTKKGADFKELKDVHSAKREWLKQLVTPDKTILTVIVVLSFVVSVLGISLSLFSQKLVDDILPSGDISRLIVGTTVLAILLLSSNAIGYYRVILASRQSRDFSNRIVGDFYNMVLYLPKKFFDSLKVGEVTARLNDASRIQRTINYLSGSFVVDVLTLLVVTVIMFLYWWMTGVIAVVGSVLFAYFFLINAKKIVEKQKSVMVNYAQSESYFFDSVQGLDAIKGSSKEDVFSGRGKGTYAVLQHSVFDLSIFSNKVSLWAKNIAVMTTVLIIVFGSYGVMTELISLGELMVIMSFGSIIIGSTSSLMTAYFTYQESKVAYNRLHEFMSVEGETLIEPDKEEAARDLQTLRFESVSFRYTGRPLLLKNISFTAEKGKLTVLLGEIGSGKSTLLNILIRLYPIETGSISVNGHSIENYGLKDWRSRVGLMPQNIKIFNATLIENICLEATEESVAKAIKLCNDLGVTKYFENLPLSYLTKVGEDGLNLSGGQRQLVGLCRALLSDPQILLLDEPTNNMDQSSRELLWSIISELKKDIICLVVTHDAQIAQKADAVVRLH